jgi:chromosome partitioning protein
MATIIVMGGSKGGSGRTTLAINLAAHSTAAGLPVLLVDGTGLSSAPIKRWMAVRRKVHPPAAPISVVSLDGLYFSQELSRLIADYSVVVIDTFLGNSEVEQAALEMADVVVVPMQWATLQTEAHRQYGYLLCHAQVMNPKLRIIMVANQTALTTLREDVVTDWSGLLSKHLPGLRQTAILPVYQRLDYSEALERGFGVIERADFKSKAVQEMAALWCAAMNTPWPQSKEEWLRDGPISFEV